MSKSNKQLHQAIWNNDTKKVDCYIRESSDLNEEDENGLRPLDIAVMTSNDKVVHCLIDSKKKIVVDTKTWFYLTFIPNEKIISNLIEYTNSSAKGCLDIQNETPLHHAVLHGCERLINLLSFLECDVNSKTKNGYTPLHYAAMKGDEPIVNILLKNGADVKVKTADGKNPLHLAVKHRHKNIVTLLLDKEVDINEQTNITGSTALHFAVENNDESLVEFLIQHKANLLAQNFAGENLLHTAAKYGHKNLVELFLNKGIDIDSVRKDNSTALLIAIDNRNPDVAQFLINSKANINVSSSSGFSPLLSAINQRYTNLSSKLLSLGSDIHQVTCENLSVLHFALQCNDENAVNFLIKQNLKINRRNHLGENELHFAARYGDKKVVEFLIKRGMNVNETSINLSTPLHYAALNFKRNKEAIIDVLLKHGAKVDVEDKNGNTALNILCQTDDYLISDNTVEKLLKKGADPTRYNKNHISPLLSSILRFHESYVTKLLEYGGNINQLNDNDDNALHIIIRHKLGCACTRISLENSVIKLGVDVNGLNKNKETPLIACLEYTDFYEGIKEVENLMKKGAKMTKNKDGESVLHLSIKKDKKELVEYFLEKGADVNNETFNGMSVLHYAAEYTKNEEIIELLLKKCNNTRLVHQKDRESRTLLHIAALQGSNELIEVLLKYDVDINAKDNYGDTPINFAINRGHIETVKLLLKNGASLTTRNKKGLTAYDLAAQEKDKHIYQYLLLR